jgi:hypothetical protein
MKCTFQYFTNDNLGTKYQTHNPVTIHISIITGPSNTNNDRNSVFRYAFGNDTPAAITFKTND